MKKQNVRSMANSAIDHIINKGYYSTQTVADFAKDIEDLRDRGFFRELVYGVVENIYYLDYIIRQASNIRLKKIDDYALNAMRIAVYEMVFLETEAYAAINEAVNNIKKKKPKRIKNFSNAVLRNISRNLEDYTKVDLEDDLERLSIKYSFNKEIVAYLSSYYDIKRLEDILKALNSRSKLNIRVNTMKTSPEDLAAKLRDQGLEIEESKISKYSLTIKNPVNINKNKYFQDGYFTIQDESSSLVSQILNPEKGKLVLDLCAAPGSKSTHLLQIMEDEGLLVSNDISANKLSLIEENFQRMGLKNYKISNFDAGILQENLLGKFDYILVDAPCSGLGVCRRKPEIKLNRRLDDIESLSSLQKRILKNAHAYLKDGGQLVYSTCTLGDRENKDVIEWAVENLDFEIERINDLDYIEIDPSKTGADGFFICKMIKNL